MRQKTLSLEEYIGSSQQEVLWKFFKEIKGRSSYYRKVVILLSMNSFAGILKNVMVSS